MALGQYFTFRRNDGVHDVGVPHHQVAVQRADVAHDGDGGEQGDGLAHAHLNLLAAAPFDGVQIVPHIRHQGGLHDHVAGHAQLGHEDGAGVDHPVVRRRGVDGHVHQLFDAPVQAGVVVGDAVAGTVVGNMLFQGGRHQDGGGGHLLLQAHVLIVQVGLVAHDGAQLAGQVDARFAGQAHLGGVFVQPFFRAEFLVEPPGHGIEEIVAGVGQALHDGLIGVLFRVAGPALGHVLLHVGEPVEAAAVADGFGGGQHPVGEARKARAHFENGAGLGAGLDGVVHQQAPFVLNDLDGRVAALHHGVQVVIGVLGQG